MRKFYYIAILFYVGVVFIHMYSSYIDKKEKIYADVDARLIRYATIADHLLCEKINTIDMNSSTISKEQDSIHRELLSTLVDDLKITYIYSLILKDNRVYFTSSSALSRDLIDDSLISHYFDEYEEASSALKNSFATKHMTYEVSRDKWGEFRSVFLPRVSEDGMVYVVGVDTDIAYINSMLDDILHKYIVEFFLYLIAIAPLFYIYYRHNQIVQVVLESDVEQKTKELRYKSIQMRYILDNVNQGFFVFDKEMKIFGEYSKKCKEIFLGEIVDKNILELMLFDYDRDFLNKLFLAIFDESDPVKIDSLISMLPREIKINGFDLSIEYRFEKNIIVVILTDITEEVNLEKKLDIEHKIMRMVVGVIANSEEFYRLIDDYDLFVSNRLAMVDDKKTPLENIKNLYRSIHTFKGIFLQKDFITTPKALHKLEDELSKWIERDDITNEKIIKYLANVDFSGWLSKDLDHIISLLGSEFVENNRNLLVNKELFVKLYNKLSSLKNSNIDISLELSELHDMMKIHMYKKLQDCFVSFDRLLEQLCEKTDKKINKLKIVDNTTTLVDDSMRGFVKSLYHIVQNSVIHGIESGEDRLLLGKDSHGNIEIILDENIDEFIIEIRDDGRGLDYELIYNKALELGIAVDKDDKTRLKELIFSDFFSTKEIVSNLAGRGVGLAAVRGEIEKLEGRCEIESVLNSGIRFIFYIPKSSIETYKDDLSMLKKDLLLAIKNSAIEFLQDTLSIEILSDSSIDFSSVMIDGVGAAIDVKGVYHCSFFVFIDKMVIDRFAKFMLGESGGEYYVESTLEIANIILGRSIKNFPKSSRDVIISSPIYLPDSKIAFDSKKAMGIMMKSDYGNVYIIINSNSEV